MRKVLLTLLLSLITLLPLKADVKSIIDSVAYLQAGEGHCTAWSIGVKQWITEGHCVDEEPLVINGEEARVVKLDKGEDLALLDGPLVTPLQVSTQEPIFEGKDGKLAETTLFGWPGDYPSLKPIVFSGHLAALDVEPTGELDEYDHHNCNLFASGVGAGMSGGPIVQGGKVVGMVEAGRAYGWPHGGMISLGHITASQTVKAIRKFAGLK